MTPAPQTGQLLLRRPAADGADGRVVPAGAAIPLATPAAATFAPQTGQLELPSPNLDPHILHFAIDISFACLALSMVLLCPNGLLIEHYKSI